MRLKQSTHASVFSRVLCLNRVQLTCILWKNKLKYTNISGMIHTAEGYIYKYLVSLTIICSVDVAGQVIADILWCIYVYIIIAIYTGVYNIGTK